MSLKDIAMSLFAFYYIVLLPKRQYLVRYSVKSSWSKGKGDKARGKMPCTKAMVTP